VRVASNETAGAQMATVTSAILIAQQVAGKATRDALFLSSFRAAALPSVMAGGAVLSLGAIFWLSRLMGRHGPRQIMPVLFALNAVALISAWTLGLSSPRAAAVVVYLQMAAFSPAMISTFWSLINERFDPHHGKRAVARVAAGGTIGGVLGGLAAWRAAAFLHPETLIALLAGVSVVGVASTLLISARELPEHPAAPARAGPPVGASAIGELKRSHFLRNLALLVACGAAISALLDYVLSAQAVVHFGKGQPLLSFFALMWLAVAVVSFLLQIALGEVALEKLGLAVSLAILPGVILLGGAFGLAVPGLVSAALLRSAEAVQRNTLFRSAYELLYTPVAEASKRSTKAIIDVGFDRLGTVVGSGMVSLALLLFAPSASKVLLGAVVVMALGTLPLVRRIHVGYVAALEESLKAGGAHVDGPAGDLPAPESQRGRPSLGGAREKLIEKVEALQPGGLTALLDDAGHAEPAVPASPGLATEALRQPAAVLSVVEELLSGDDMRVRQGLSRLRPTEPSVACAILLLAHPQLHLHALKALRGVAGPATGQLLDALLTSTIDFAVRRRIPRILSSAPTQRAADGLLLGIADPRFEVRYECGRALSSVTSANLDIVVSRQMLIEAVQREVQTEVLETAGAELEYDSPEEEPNALVDVLLRDRVDRSLEYIFTLLSVMLEREPLRRAFRALYHSDSRYRGTALEYLDTVLPSEVRDAVWPLLGQTGPLPPPRPAREILAELALAEAAPR
jgi:ATP:ADP antiporter, AAA family